MLENILKPHIKEALIYLNEKISSSKALLPYCSFDLRYSGFKSSQVDCNMFSGGFGNLNQEAKTLSTKKFNELFLNIGAKKILLLAENHSRNEQYLKNLCDLAQIIQNANIEVYLATDELDDFVFQNKTIFNIKNLSQKFDAILLNNDLTTGVPTSLSSFSCPILPSTKLGWFNRKKSTFCKIYTEVVKDFAKTFNLDPWLFDSYHAFVTDINFKEQIGLSQIKTEVLKILDSIEQKYKLYGIKQEPAVFIKSNTGTYGMGIEVISSPEQIETINKNFRKKMHITKSGKITEEVLIQEAIPNFFINQEVQQEEVTYCVNSSIVGSFFRLNSSNLGTSSNLNSSGMIFDSKSHFQLKIIEIEISKIATSLALIAAQKEVQNLREEL